MLFVEAKWLYNDALTFMNNHNISDYDLAITTYQSNGGEQKKYKSEIGIDMGIKTTITTSDAENIMY